jgi:hypothetical protein
MGPVKQMALIFALCQLHNYCLGDADQTEPVVPANSNDSNQPSTVPNNASTSPFSDEGNENIVANMLNGGEHFDEFTDEELVREQSSRIRLAMRKIVENSGLHRSVISFNNRNNN